MSLSFAQGSIFGLGSGFLSVKTMMPSSGFSSLLPKKFLKNWETDSIILLKSAAIRSENRAIWKRLQWMVSKQTPKRTEVFVRLQLTISAGCVRSWFDYRTSSFWAEYYILHHRNLVDYVILRERDAVIRKTKLFDLQWTLGMIEF